jgi:hypothetical protein
MVLDRLWPVRKGQPVNVDMPPINTPQDVFPVIASIWKAIREGALSADEASALSVVIDRSIQAIQLHDSNLRRWCPDAEIAAGSNLPRRLSGENLFLFV